MVKSADRTKRYDAIARAVIVEDDVFVRATIEARLAKRKVETISFGTYARSKEFFLREKADFAIIDLGLPDGEGLDLIRCIRETTLNKDIPIIIATANRSNLVVMDAIGKYRAIYVSQKPILWSCLEYVLDETVLKQPQSATA